MYLPLAGSAKSAAKTLSQGELAMGCERILLVDDEIAVLKMAKRMLERLGYTVTAFDDSQEALETFSADPDSFDLLISDLTMPKLTGIQLAEEILAIRSGFPVVICTGFSDRISEEAIRSMGIRGLVMKPVSAEKMAKAVRIAFSDSKDASAR